MQFITKKVIKRALARNLLNKTNFMFRPSFRFFATEVVKCPTMGDSITEGTIQEYTAQEGEFVARDDIVAVIETDKVMVDIRAPADGVIKKYFYGEGDVIEVDADFFELDTDAKGEPKAAGSAAPEAKEEPAAEEPAKAAPPPPKQEETKAASPAAASPPPSKPSSPAKRPPAPKGVPAPPGIQVGKDGLSTITGSRTETRVKMSRMRQTIAKRLKDAQNTNAMLTTFNEVDMGAFMDLRKEFQDVFVKKHGVKLGFMGAFVRGVVQAVKEQPVVNALIEGDEMVYRDYVDISVAVATPSGLVVPVLRN